MRRWLMLLLCALLLPPLAEAEGRKLNLPDTMGTLMLSATEYQQDGRAMLTVTAETTVFRGWEDKMLVRGDRLISTGETMMEADGSTWHKAWLPGWGYGHVSGADVLPAEPLQIPYQPGFGVSAALFEVEDPSAVRVEIVSLDNLEFPVITVRSTYHRQREDGSYVLSAAFDTASDVCKTTVENLCATLYDLNGQPIEVLTLIFDAPNW